MFAPAPAPMFSGAGGSFFGGGAAMAPGQPAGGGMFGAAQARMGFGQPAAQRPPLEQPTPAPIPEDTGNPNQGIILAAILGGSAILGIATGCLLFRKKGSNGDSDDDMDSDDSEDSSSEDSD